MGVVAVGVATANSLLLFCKNDALELPSICMPRLPPPTSLLACTMYGGGGGGGDLMMMMNLS